MAKKHVAAFALFDDRATAADAAEWLKTSGFRPEDVCMLHPRNVGSKDLGYEKHTKAPEGAAAGGGAGAALGAALGWLAGAGTLLMPGMDFAAAGPILSALSGMGAGMVLGGLTGALAGSGLPEYEAKRYVGRIRKGGVLLSVHCDDRTWANQATHILKRMGGTDVSITREAAGEFAEASRPFPRRQHVS
ncbi:MAG: DUF3341 domain-containing protein [Acidobacteria bacterium]|nr:DUF3341 domain-containing protein [Acidobacteriota bacterium]